jgi:hypothetical protein
MAAVLPELDVEKVKRWCRQRVPATFQDEVRLEVTTRGGSLSIHECRPVWRGTPGDWTRMAIAQIRYDGDGAWTLSFGDRNGGWRRYTALEGRQRIDVILEEIGTDPTCIFWG